MVPVNPTVSSTKAGCGWQRSVPIRQFRLKLLGRVSEYSTIRCILEMVYIIMVPCLIYLAHYPCQPLHSNGAWTVVLLATYQIGTDHAEECQ
jgi:hypothetical protein